MTLKSIGYGVTTHKCTTQKDSFNQTTQEIKGYHLDLTEHIQDENTKQKNNIRQTVQVMADNVKIKTLEMKSDIDSLKNSFEKNKNELELVSNNFKNLGEQIPKALQISLTELNRGLTSLTTQFQKDYKKIMDNYK